MAKKQSFENLAKEFYFKVIGTLLAKDRDRIRAEYAPKLRERRIEWLYARPPIKEIIDIALHKGASREIEDEIDHYFKEKADITKFFN